ncbi:transporter substrate-binding domain-containing protein [Lawsonibacter celer]|uniref:transporter substrate-binding domain-containing protein n=1 Tax=Lawsonibacter celer TaxID=2986526 RepID=UPI0016450355|nr:transporter substrate-binding domain-containing protein [Lawsonibacter celer]
MKKKLLALTLVFGLALSLAACSGGTQPGTADTPAPATDSPVPATGSPVAESDLAYLQDKGSLIIGYTVYEPMNYTDENGEFTGFDTELARAVCEKLGLEPEFVIINWDTKEVALEAKDIDCIWNGLTLDPDREANMACTVPYVKNAQVVVVKEGFDYADTASLAGKTVCAEIGSAGETMCRGNDESEPDAGLAQAEFVGKSVQTDCLMEVKSGTADAAVLDMTLANAMTGEGTNYDDLVVVDHLGEENYGVAFRKGSDTRDAVNEIFAEMTADGSLKALADKYGLELAD